MRAGAYRELIAIQDESEVSDGMGGFTPSWSDVSGLENVPAAVWDMKGTERLDAMKLEQEITHRIRFRYVSGITAKNRVKWKSNGDAILNIVQPPLNPDGKRRDLELLATIEV